MGLCALDFRIAANPDLGSGIAEVYLEYIVYSSARLDPHGRIRQWNFHVHAILF